MDTEKRSVSSQVRDYLIQWSHDNPDQRFMSTQIGRSLGLKTNTIAATLNHYTKCKLITPIGRLGRQYVYEVLDPTFTIGVRTRAPVPYSKTANNNSYPHKTRPDLPTLADLGASTEAPVAEFASLVAESVPVPPEKSLVTLALEFALLVERSVLNPDLT